MARTLEELIADRPIDREQVEAMKNDMLARVRGYRLRELRETYGLTQLDMARSLHMSQETISRIEHGDVSQMSVETIRRYVESLGGKLRVEVEIGETRHTIA